MKSKAAFSKKDLIVILACVVFLLINLGAVGAGGRQRAKEAVCLSNLRQWGIVCQIYTESNDGLFWSGLEGRGHWWPWQLEDKLKDWKINKIWFCPTAKIPASQTSKATTFTAWGIYTESHMDSATGVVYSAGPNGLSGSYGLNGYVLTIPTNGTFEGGRPASDGWRTPNVPGAANVPVFVDALRFDLWPLHTDSPPPTENQPWNNISMRRACINRHNGAVNVLFMDWSARKVGLKELWTLRWHKSFNTTNSWTLAGGVTPDDWLNSAPWMQNFKDY